MSNISVDYDILNQKQTPAFYASSLATRPAFGFPGRIFIDTDTPSSGIYRDTGSAWVQVADPGAGTTGTLQQVTTNGNTTTNSIQVQGIDFSDGAGTGLYNIAIGNQTMGANTTGNNNIAIGYQNLKFNTTGALNVAVGNTALVNNTTGSQNTAVGQLALNLNTTGSQNTALGNATLQNNTTGSSNTAIGHASLVANTTASFNTAVGYTSMQLNTTGTNNTALGFNSLNANTTGNNNTALGLSALSGNTTASFNTAIGSSSLQNNTTGDNNTALGYFSLAANTTGANNVGIGQSSLTANTTGFSNVGIGSRALTANTTGAQNVAIGNDALYINTTGNTNTAIGTAALSLNTTGGGNTAIGVSALNSNTTANYNTAVGSSSLAGNTTGANNTAIGYNTLAANTTSNNNTALGFQSLQVSTGAGNTAVGVSTLNENTTGFQNSALGISALQKNTTGNYNTGIGNNALNLNTTGQLNTTIGYNSGSAITTGSNNTIIGAYAGTTTLASNIVLSDGAGNVRLFSDANGLIGINQAVGSTIGGQLDIHTTQTYALVLNGLSTSNAYTAFSNASVGKWRIGNTYNAGANSFDIFNLTSSAAAITITSANNVGIGVTPSAWTAGGQNIEVGSAGNIIQGQASQIAVIQNATFNSSWKYSANGFASFTLQTTGQHQWFNAPSGTAGNAITFTQAMTLFSTGNLAIGSTTDDTTNKLQVTGSGIFNGGLIVSNTSDVYPEFKTSSAGADAFLGFTNTGDGDNAWSVGRRHTGEFWISNYTGNFNSGTRTQALIISTSNVITISNLAGTGSRAVLADTNGVLSAPVSDISVKENINTIGYGLSEILKMNPVWFNYNDEYKNYGEGRQNGNIAQEMEAIIPEAVFTTPSTGKMGINYDQLHAVYIKAIQELKAEIDALKNK